MKKNKKRVMDGYLIFLTAILKNHGPDKMIAVDRDGLPYPFGPDGVLWVEVKDPKYATIAETMQVAVNFSAQEG